MSEISKNALSVIFTPTRTVKSGKTIFLASDSPERNLRLDLPYR